MRFKTAPIKGQTNINKANAMMLATSGLDTNTSLLRPNTSSDCLKAFLAISPRTSSPSGHYTPNVFGRL